jgi:spore germination protein YaaH
MDNVLAYHQDNFIQNVTNLVASTGADGVVIDFEEPSSASTALYAEMMGKINTSIKAQNSSHLVGMAIPPKLDYSPIFQNAALDSYVDYVFLMAYDMSTSKTGANAPYCSTKYDIEDAVSDTLEYYNPDKVILGLPLYGRDYTTNSSVPGSPAFARSTIGIADAMTNANTYGRQWDSDTSSPFYCYQVNGQWHQVWYDDIESLRMRMAYSRDNGYSLGLYRCAYESDDMWNSLFAEEYIPPATRVAPTFDVTYETEQLNITASVNGVFNYSVTGNMLNFMFTPDDDENYSSVSRTISINFK